MRNVKLFITIAMLCLGGSAVAQGGGSSTTYTYTVSNIGLSNEDSNKGGLDVVISTEYTIEYNSSSKTLTFTTRGSGGQISASNYTDYISAKEVDGYNCRIFNVNYNAKIIEVLYWKENDNYPNLMFQFGDVRLHTGSYDTGMTTYTLADDEVAVALKLDKYDENFVDSLAATATYAIDTERAAAGTDGKRTTLYTPTKNFGKLCKWSGDAAKDYNYYSVTKDLWYSDATSVTIPATVNLDGKEYKVVAIPKYGFCYEDKLFHNTKACPGEGSTIEYDSWRWVDFSNNYLTSVTFESESNIRYIGDYAFMGCRYIRSMTIPRSVEYIGVGEFECCERLATIDFQKNMTDNSVTGKKEGQVNFEKLFGYTFFWCTGLKSIDVPEGVTHIGGSGSSGTDSYTFQYNFQLERITLPNTLTTIGGHFLCCAVSLTKLTIPASVTFINGAFLHGCESLEKVILLGDAAALKYSIGGSNGNTFDYNNYYCANHVQTCEFFILSDYEASYRKDKVWSLVDEDGKTSGTRNNGYNDITCKYGNKLTVISAEERDYVAGRWVTAIFPHGVKNYKSIFGENTKVAKMASATESLETEPSGKLVRMYTLSFSLIDGDDIPEGVPYMFCPGNNVSNYEMISVDDMTDSDFRLDMTNTHAYYVDVEDGARIFMKGQYVDFDMALWDFYFMYPNKDYSQNAKFWRVTDNVGFTIRPTRCYWTVELDGLKTDIVSYAKSNIYDNTTGIDNIETKVVIEGIYDLQGRKLDIPAEELPKGIFIVNGKKVAVK